MKLTFLGTGTSFGVPQVGCSCAVCRSGDPRDRRSRVGALVEAKGTRLLIDTPPELRLQLIAADVDRVDAILFTHDHADHTHGIDDLRMVAYAMKKRIDCYFEKPTLESLVERFSYCFKTAEGSSYPPILTAKEIFPGRPFRIAGGGGDIEVLPLAQAHGEITSLGYRFGGLAYSPDISDIPPETLPLLEGLDVWVVDALRYTPHPSHFHVKKALEWIGRLKPKRAILTHMTTDLDYDALKRELPQGVEPAYDEMVIEV